MLILELTRNDGLNLMNLKDLCLSSSYGLSVMRRDSMFEFLTDGMVDCSQHGAETDGGREVISGGEQTLIL